VLLIGQLGNGGVSWSGDQQRPLRSLLSGRFVDSWKAIREYQRNRRTSFPRAVWAQIVRPMQVRAKAFAFRHGWSDLAMGHSLMAPEFARRTGMAARIRAAGYDPLQSAVLDARAQQLRVLLPDINPIGAIWHEAGAGYGLDALDPTADVRLIEFVLRIPDEQFVRGANDRWLMRRGVQGLLPPEVQWNASRPAGADLPLRLRADGEAPMLRSPNRRVADRRRIPRYGCAAAELGRDSRRPLPDAFAAAPALRACSCLRCSSTAPIFVMVCRTSDLTVESTLHYSHSENGSVKMDEERPGHRDLEGRLGSSDHRRDRLRPDRGGLHQPRHGGFGPLLYLTQSVASPRRRRPSCPAAGSSQRCPIPFSSSHRCFPIRPRSCPEAMRSSWFIQAPASNIA
jgi:hypothetical protein